jgi:hypothetical protein
MPPSRLSCPGELTCHRPAEACAACRITHPGTAAGPAQLGLGGFPLEARELDPAGYRLALEEWATLPRGESAPHPCFFWAPLEYGRSTAHLAEVLGRAAERGRAETRRQLGLPDPEAIAAVPRAEAPIPAAPLVRDFCGHRITTVEWHGRQIFFVDEIAEALEYSEARSLRTHIRSDWSDEAQEGEEYLLITNGDIRALESLRCPEALHLGMDQLACGHSCALLYDGSARGEEVIPLGTLHRRVPNAVVAGILLAVIETPFVDLVRNAIWERRADATGNLLPIGHEMPAGIALAYSSHGILPAHAS